MIFRRTFPAGPSVHEPERFPVPKFGHKKQSDRHQDDYQDWKGWGGLSQGDDEDDHRYHDLDNGVHMDATIALDVDR